MSNAAATAHRLPQPRLKWSKCSKCLKEINRKEFLRNDFLCDKCAEEPETYPFASTGTCPCGNPNIRECERCRG